MKSGVRTVSTNRTTTLCGSLVWNRKFKLLLESIGFSNITCSAEYAYKNETSSANQMFTFEAVRKE